MQDKGCWYTEVERDGSITVPKLEVQTAYLHLLGVAQLDDLCVVRIAHHLIFELV